MSLFSRLCAVVSGNEYDDDNQDLDYELDEDLPLAGGSGRPLDLDMTEPPTDGNPFGHGNVIGMPGISTSPAEVIVMEPRSFAEMPLAIQALRERKTIILNLRMMEPDQAQRAVDFVSGGTFATDGKQERVGDSIFIFAPSCVNVTIAEPVDESDTAAPADQPAAQQKVPSAPSRNGTGPAPKSGGVAPHPAWNHQPLPVRPTSSF